MRMSITFMACSKCGSAMTQGASHIGHGLQWECHQCGSIINTTQRKPVITCRKVWSLVSDVIRYDHQWEAIPGPVFKALFDQNPDDMADTVLDCIEDLVKRTHRN